MTYNEGFGDAVILCYDEVKDSKDLTEAQKKVSEIFELVQADKVHKLRAMLKMIKR